MSVPRLCLLAVLSVLLVGCEVSLFNFPEESVDPYERGVWLKNGIDEGQRKADIRECYEVAAAQVARDERIDRDIRATETNRGVGQGSAELLESMSEYGYGQRRDRLFARCMADKGYTKQ